MCAALQARISKYVIQKLLRGKQWKLYRKIDKKGIPTFVCDVTANGKVPWNVKWTTMFRFVHQLLENNINILWKLLVVNFYETEYAS